MLVLPSELVNHVTAILGERGGAWLDTLADIVADLQAEWTIEVHEAFAAGEFNFVAPATRADGENVVVKIAPPYDDDEFLREAEFLRRRDGRGTVRLFAQDIERRAILIERALPGRNLAEVFADMECDSIGPAIDVLRSIAEPPPDDLINIKTVDDWFEGMRRAESTGFPADYVSKALEIYARLSSASDRTYYLHGDFHPANIVSATRSPHLAIDPKGVVGHIGYDIAVFLNNYHWWQETKPDTRSRLDYAVQRFSAAFDIDPLGLRQWAFAQMVLGAWWSFEDMPEFYDNAVAKADIWNV